MKSNSTVFPKKFTQTNGKIYIVDMSTIIKNINDNLDIIDDSYTYDMYELPIENRENLTGYIEGNYKLLLDFAIAKDIKSKITPEVLELEKATREIEIINLLTDLGVI